MVQCTPIDSLPRQHHDAHRRFVTSNIWAYYGPTILFSVRQNEMKKIMFVGLD